MATATVQSDAIADLLAQGVTAAHGRILFWNAARGYGFMRLVHAQIQLDIFLPGGEIRKKDFPELQPGSEMIFDLAGGQTASPGQRPRASNARLAR